MVMYEGLQHSLLFHMSQFITVKLTCRFIFWYTGKQYVVNFENFLLSKIPFISEFQKNSQNSMHVHHFSMYVSLSAGMICLLDVYNKKKEKIAEECSKMLDERISLWRLIVTVMAT